MSAMAILVTVLAAEPDAKLQKIFVAIDAPQIAPKILLTDDNLCDLLEFLRAFCPQEFQQIAQTIPRGFRN
jgi:hypothetical protein